MTRFEQWWYEEGSQAPYTHHDSEEHTKRMCEIAWANGAYVEREECAKICSEFPDVGYVKAILTCDYHSYLINKRGTKMSAIPISQMANDILKIIEEVALDYPEEEREELKAVMLGQLGLAMFNRPMEGKND